MDLAHGFNESRPAIREKPHDLVLVAIVRRAQILDDGLVEDAERMREIDVPINLNRGALADTPSLLATVGCTLPCNEKSSTPLHPLRRLRWFCPRSDALITGDDPIARGENLKLVSRNMSSIKFG
jgi:hypothetical protein